MQEKKYRTAVLLHNVRSAHNVGSIFRTADAAGVERIFISGYTPVPVDRFGRVQKKIAKTALGAEKSVPWEHHFPVSRLINDLRNRYEVVGVEQDSHARDYRTFVVKKPTVFIFGNEVHGLSRALRKKCDTLVEIPMRGTKESLNVSVAAGIILFQAISH